jgi:hypothetical protein
MLFGMRWSIEKIVSAIGDTVLLNKSATPVFRILVIRAPSSLGVLSFVIHFPVESPHSICASSPHTPNFRSLRASIEIRPSTPLPVALNAL